MKSERAFETVWSCCGQEVERRTIQAGDMDAALVAAWMDLPTISRQDHKPCDTMHITDTATTESLTEDVPPFTLPPRRIGTAVLILVAGCVAFWMGIWMSHHGWSHAGKTPQKWMLNALMAFPLAWIFAILVVAMAQQARQDAAAEWKKDFGNLRPAAAPDEPRLARVVIATFSLWRTLPRMAFALGIIGALFWFPLASRMSSGRWDLWHPLVMACGAAFLVLILPTLRQLLFDGGVALWIQGGELVASSHAVLWMPIWSITKIEVGLFSQPKRLSYDAILLTGSDGTVIPVQYTSFRESPEDIAARLNALLRLPAASQGPAMAKSLPGRIVHQA